MEKTLLKIREVKKIYGVGQETIYRWLDEGLPRYIESPRNIYYDKNEIDNHIKKKVERI